MVQKERFADLSFLDTFEFSSNGYMGGGEVDFGTLENDMRLELIFGYLDKFQKNYPGILSNLRHILEPGAGSGTVTLNLYKYFSTQVFPNGFPPNFQHLGVEITSSADDWYQQQIALEELNLPSSPRGRFLSHYKLQKGTDFLEFAKDPANAGQFDCIFELAIYDLLSAKHDNIGLFGLSRQLLKKDGLLISSYLEIKKFNDDPNQAGFERIFDNGRSFGPTFWRAI